jgi:superoxide reductase
MEKEIKFYRCKICGNIVAAVYDFGVPVSCCGEEMSEISIEEVEKDLGKEVKFVRCEICGNIVGMMNDSGAPVVCCGENMKELKANTVDASVEKHVPVVIKEGKKLEIIVGSVEHPMTPEHHIEWIFARTTNEILNKRLSPSDRPIATFTVDEDDKFVDAYEYCNLHGLWKAE